MLVMHQFGAQNRLEPSLLRRSQKFNRPIQPIPIGESERVLALGMSRLTQRLQRRHTPHWGIRRVCVQVDKVGRHSMRPSITDRPFAEPIMELIKRHREPLRPISPVLVRR
jgi:poly-beta-hydroxyalkanoate depolymerase